MGEKKRKSKIVSAFADRCPGCERALYRHQDGRVDRPWNCLACDATLCSGCYHEHTASDHPNMNVIYERKPAD